MKSQKKILGIILTYNCAHLIEDLYKRIPLSSFNDIIVVDDNSSDHTLKIANQLGLATYTHNHLGYGGNIKFGLKKAMELNADYIVEIHGDGQYDPSIIPEALKKIRDYDLLLGSRFVDIRQPLRDKMPLIRFTANILLSFIYRVISGIKLTEFHTGFHIYTKEFLSKAGFKNTSLGHLYSLEIIFQANYLNMRICEVPIRCDYGKDHTSISIINSAVYSFKSFLLLVQLILARFGLKTGIFKYY